VVVKRQCSFCAREIEPGTGMMFVKRDGTVFHFCSSSCRKQQLYLGRVGHRFKWTRAHALKKSAERSNAARSSAAPAPPAKPARRSRSPKPSAPTGETTPPAVAPPEAPTTAAVDAPAPPAPKPRARKPRAAPAPPSTEP